MQFHRRFGEWETDALVFGDRLAKGFPSLGMFKRYLKCPTAIAHRPRGVVYPADGNPMERGLKALVQRADKLPRLNRNILQAEFRLVAADAAKHPDNSLDMKPGDVGWHQKGTDAALLGGYGLRVLGGFGAGEIMQ
jgi:hypothetical protein